MWSDRCLLAHHSYRSSSRLSFEFILNRGKPNETKYEFSTRETLNGPIEYNKSYLKVRTDGVCHVTLVSRFSSTRMITSFGSFISLNLGRNVTLAEGVFSLNQTYTYVEIFNLLNCGCLLYTYMWYCFFVHSIL